MTDWNTDRYVFCHDYGFDDHMELLFVSDIFCISVWMAMLG